MNPREKIEAQLIELHHAMEAHKELMQNFQKQNEMIKEGMESLVEQYNESIKMVDEKVDVCVRFAHDMQAWFEEVNEAMKLNGKGD